jgi:hypothetical protein
MGQPSPSRQLPESNKALVRSTSSRRQPMRPRDLEPMFSPMTEPNAEQLTRTRHKLTRLQSANSALRRLVAELECAREQPATPAGSGAGEDSER